MSLQLSFSIADKTTTISLKGSLNEYSSALNGVEVNPQFDLNLDLKDLVSINSLGIRNFHSWIYSIECQRLRLLHCPRVFVHQLNLVSGFLPPKAEIESFFVPYFSEASGEEVSVLFTKFLEYKIVDGNVKISFPKVTDSKGNPMELDVLEEAYFKFLGAYS
ncbi:hypothetical protein ACLSU7_15460 [Bdellovibrio sp. HCB185ZH]|uniref:hypothetical protein n=1 Tax=Bdellovibrio sp. HCB185ZH TaxID=3394235 RepID=UPI0039A6E302